MVSEWNGKLAADNRGLQKNGPAGQVFGCCYYGGVGEREPSKSAEPPKASSHWKFQVGAAWGG